MRLHLPKRLLRAVLTALVTTSAALSTLGSSAYAGMGTGEYANTFYLNGKEADAQGANASYCEWSSSGSVYTSIKTDPEGVSSVINKIAAGDIKTATIDKLYLPDAKSLIISAGNPNGFTEGDGLTINDIQIAGESGTATMRIAASQIVTLASVSQGTLDVTFIEGGDNFKRKLQIKGPSPIALGTITNSWGLDAINIESGSQLTAGTISFESGNNGSGDMQGGKITGGGTVQVTTFEAGNVGNYTISVSNFTATTINAACRFDKTLTLSSANLTVGTLTQTQGKVVLDSTNAVISNLLFNGGTLTNDGTLNITGKFKGGTLTNNGTLTFASGCVIDISGMTFETHSFDSSESDGYVDCHAAHLVVSGTTATNQGVIIKNGDDAVSGASFDGRYVYKATEQGYLLIDNDSYSTSTLKSGDGSEGSVGVASEASYLKIASGKTLTVDSTDWTLGQIYGEGNVSIASNLEFSVGPSKATGRLNIASNKQLTIGGGTSSNANLNSFTAIDIDGGTLKLNFKQGTFNNVTVSANGGTIDFYDSGSATTQQTFAGTTTLNGKLNIKGCYKVLANFQSVTGSGGVSITGYRSTFAHEAATYNFALQNTYTGTIELNDSWSTVNVSGTLGAATLKKTSGSALNYSGAEINGATLDAVTLTKSDGCVTVKGTSTIKNIINRTSGNTYGYAMVVASGGSLSVQGVNDFTETTTSGDTTTLYSGLIGVASGGSLTVEEDAVLTVKGLFNSSDTASSNGNVTLKIGGTLNVVGNNSNTYVNDLTIEGSSGEKTTAATFDGKLNVDNTLSIANGGSVETKGKSAIATLTGSGALKASGDTKVTNASGFSGSLESGAGATLNIEGGFGVKELAALKIDGGLIGAKTGDASVTSVSISEVVLAGGVVGVYSVQDVEATVQTGSLTVSGSSMLYADLELTQGGTLTLDSSLTMGSTLTLNSGITLSGSLLTGWADHSQALTLFSGVDSLTLGSGDTAITAEVGKTYDASSVFANEGMDNYKLQIVGTAGNYTVQMVQNAPTPEPTTATLSLLALMGLAARRRRKA